jgi:hypothetical protein
MTQISAGASMRAVLGTAVLVAGVLVGVSVGASAPVGGQPANCASQPYLPQFGYQLPPSSPTSAIQFYPSEPKQLPPFGTYAGRLAGKDLVDPGSGEVDTDGDGVPDQIDVSGAPLVITRGDGVVTITAGGANVRPVRTEPLDLDGDGHDEIIVAVGAAFYVVPGTTATGTHAIGDVGIAIPNGSYQAVGDQVDGPGDDLAVPAGDHVVLTSGNAIMAAGAGGSVPAYVPASGPLPSDQFTPLRLDDGPPWLAFVTGGGADGGPTTVTLWHRGELATYRTPFDGYFHGVDAIDTGAARYLVASSDTRSGFAAYAWNLDDHCAVLPALVSSTTSITSTTRGTGVRPAGTAPRQGATSAGDTAPAAGAAPVRATSRFTG